MASSDSLTESCETGETGFESELVREAVERQVGRSGEAGKSDWGEPKVSINAGESCRQQSSALSRTAFRKITHAQTAVGRPIGPSPHTNYFNGPYYNHRYIMYVYNIYATMLHVHMYSELRSSAC